MPANTQRPVLIVGGSGIVGRRLAKVLRRLHPGLPITIGASDLAKARALGDRDGRCDRNRRGGG